jgi:hypothetical protein
MFTYRSGHYVRNDNISDEENSRLEQISDVEATISFINNNINNSRNIHELLGNISRFRNYNYFENENFNRSLIFNNLPLNILKSIKHITNNTPKLVVNWQDLTNPYMNNTELPVISIFNLTEFTRLYQFFEKPPENFINNNVIIDKIGKYFSDIIQRASQRAVSDQLSWFTNSVFTPNINKCENVYDSISLYINIINNLDIFTLMNSYITIPFDINAQIHEAIKILYEDKSPIDNILSTYILIYTLLYGNIPIEQLYDTIKFFIGEGAKINLNILFLPLIPIIDDRPVQYLIDNDYNKYLFIQENYKRRAIILDIVSQIINEINESIREVMMITMTSANLELSDSNLVKEVTDLIDNLNLKEDVSQYGQRNNIEYIPENLLHNTIEQNQNWTNEQVRLYSMKSYSRFLQSIR